jgi:hypothetical protein
MRQGLKMTHVWRHALLGRAIAAAVLVLLGGLSTARGYCPMPAGDAKSSEDGDPHGCCRSGVSGDVPSCCHADEAPPVAATFRTAPGHVPGLARVFTAHAPYEAPVALAAGAPAHSTHGPPHTILRI